jgi:hypothetical protein
MVSLYGSRQYRLQQQQLQREQQQLQIEQQQLQIEQQQQQTIRHNELSNLIWNSNAISFNRAANNAIIALRDRDGNAPVHFPVTRSELFSLPSAQCSIFLVAYGLPVGGNADQKRSSLANHIGLIL